MEKEFSSFRDRSGFVFYQNDAVYRSVSFSYKPHYDLLFSSGLYQKLVEDKLLLPVEEVNEPCDDAYKLLRAPKIDFISYPYEWCFSQYKDAALLTLEIQRQALRFGMTLKDASAYNVQFFAGKPVFIDTLSFEKLDENSPWVAYKQFCQHFLAPLALMSMKDSRLSSLMRNFIDGIPLDLAATLLPKFSSFGVWANIHVNALAQKKNSGTESSLVKNMSLKKHLILIEGLMQTIINLKSPNRKTSWQDYYTFTNYSEADFQEKTSVLKEFVAQLPRCEMLWDMGANNGYFSRQVLVAGAKAIAFDMDDMAVEANYLFSKEKQENNILPLVFDMLNPSPSIGWNNQERGTILSRGKPDVIMALALIHHLAISNNVPFEYLAQYFSQYQAHLIVEFVAREDSQVERMLVQKTGDFSWYRKENFEADFLKCFSLVAKKDIGTSARTLYLLAPKK